jgi:hypothetical protein
MEVVAPVVFGANASRVFRIAKRRVDLSAGGRRLRVRFTNAIGQYPLVIGVARVARPAADVAPGAIDPATDRVMIFGGAAGVTVQPGAVFVSDPVELPAPSLSTVAISVSFRAGPGRPSIGFGRKSGPKGEIQTFMLDKIYPNLPTPPYTEEEKELVAADVYAHVWRQAISGAPGWSASRPN